MLFKEFACVAVANRGEAAVRFIRAVLSWSREDGKQLSAYLDVDRIVTLARQAGADPHVRAAQKALADARLADRRKVEEDYERVLADVTARVQTDVAREFDAVHNVARALDVGSLDALMTAQELRPSLCARLEAALEEDRVGSTSHS
jgi:hypothetical protein